jgi:hypothetical protein
MNLSRVLTRRHAAGLATLAAGVAIGCALVGVASAAPSVAPSSAPKTVTHHYALAASAFAPDGLHNTGEDYFNQWNPTTLSNTDSGRCFNAGLSLPPGVTLVSVTAYYTAGSNEMIFEINRQQLATHAYVDLAEVDTATASTPTYTHVTETFKSSQATVNMGLYAYSAGVCPYGNTTFSGLIITYTQPAT